MVVPAVGELPSSTPWDQSQPGSHEDLGAESGRSGYDTDRTVPSQRAELASDRRAEPRHPVSTVPEPDQIQKWTHGDLQSQAALVSGDAEGTSADHPSHPMHQARDRQVRVHPAKRDAAARDAQAQWFRSTTRMHEKNPRGTQVSQDHANHGSFASASTSHQGPATGTSTPSHRSRKGEEVWCKT